MAFLGGGHSPWSTGHHPEMGFVKQDVEEDHWETSALPVMETQPDCEKDCWSQSSGIGQRFLESRFIVSDYC
jgi:hypothetical protein